MVTEGDAQTKAIVIDIHQAKRFTADALNVETLCSLERLHATLVCFEAGQSVPPHHHEHRDELFDVVEGAGIFVLAGQRFDVGPGALVIVPAGVEHALENQGSRRWLLRETAYERVYACTAVALVMRAILRRFRRFWRTIS